MAEKNKNNLVVNDKTYVKKPEIHYSYKFQPYVKDLGGRPGKNITQEDRNKRLRHESDINAVRNVVKGLNNTFGKAISGAAAFYGGGWALNRLLHLNKPSTLGQFFGRYVLPANTADNVSDGVELIFDPSIEGAVDLGSGVVLGRFKDLSKPIRLVGELIGQGANINNMKNGGYIRKMQTASGGPIYSTIEKSDNTRVSYNPIIEMSKRKGLIGTLAGILLLTEHDEAQEKRKLEEANQKRLKRRKELEDKVNAQKKHSLSSSSLINAANDLQYMDTPEGQELAKMNREDEANESAYIASLPWWKKGMFYANKLVNAGFIPVGGGTTGMAAAKTPQQTLSGFISKFGEPGNLERTVNNIILENEHWLPKETGMFAQKHSSVGSNYRKIFEELWGKENTDRLTDDLLGKLILIRNRLIDTNIPLKGDFVYVVDGQAKAYRNGLEIGYLSNSYINNGKALHPEMVKKQGTNNAGVSELLYNGTILAENRPIISGSRLLMPEVTTHIWSKYPTRKLISTEGVHAWPLRTAQERGIKLNYEKNWHTLPEFSKLHQLALDENIRTNLTGLPIYELSEPSYLPMVKNARVFDISLLRDGYINLDFTPGFAYKQGGKMNILEFLKNGSGIHIKKENRGKFTDYCGGKVTSACIARGKKSPNATIRKRATFAANARKWKHENGGIIKAEDGTKVNTFQKIGNWLNSDTGKAISGTLLNGLSAGFLAKLMNDFINEYDAASKAKLKSLLNVSSKDYISKALSTMNPNENLSSLVLLKRAYDIGMLEALKSYNEEKENIDLLMFNLKQYTSLLNLNNFFNAFSQLGSLLNYTNKKTTDNGAPSNDNT